MKKKTISEYVKESLIGKDWRFAGEIARTIAFISKHKESTIERELRRLASGEFPVLARRLVKIDGKGLNVAQYKWIGISLPEANELQQLSLIK